MKKTIFLFILPIFLTSCVWDESLLDNAENIPASGWNQSMNEQSRAASNTFLWKNGDYAGHQTVDWNGASDGLKLDGNETAYAYDGTNGEFTVDAGIPSIYYRQAKDDIFSDRFNYAVITDEENIKFHPAFGEVKFIVKNNHEGLYLKIRGISLGQIARRGIFHFPFYGKEAEWIISNQKYKSAGKLSMDFETVGLEFGEKYSYPTEGTIPLIPQTNRGWNIECSPGADTGTYAVLDCIIYNVFDTEKGYQDGKDYPIWCGDDGDFAEVHLPVDINIRMGETTVIEIVLKENCPWYDASTWIPEKVLNPISFNVTVENWN